MDLARAKQRFDVFQQRHLLSAFTVGVVRHTATDRGGQLAALLAYYGFLSLFPLLLVLVTVLRVVLADDLALQERVLDTAMAQIPVVGDDLSQVATPTASGWILLVGTLVALWAGLAVLDTLQDVIQRVWEIPSDDQTPWLSRKLRSLVLIGVFGLALGVVVAIGVAGTLIDLPLAARVVTFVLTLLLATAVALMALVVLGGGGPPWRHHIPGAVIIGVGWVVLQAAGTWLVTARVTMASRTYGTFAIVLGLFAWLTLLGWLVVLANEVNVVRSKHLWPVSLLGSPPDEPPGTEPGTDASVADSGP